MMHVDTTSSSDPALCYAAIAAYGVYARLRSRLQQERQP